MNDPYVKCPYNAVHLVPRSRIQGHIVKCQKNYPSLAICPYNATHRMNEPDLKIHVRNCPDKEVNFHNYEPKTTGELKKPIPLFQRNYLPETDPNHEMWDD